jgi:hypothetical protein
MPLPWDVPPKPTTGEFGDEIYIAVGQALSNRELVERELGEIFSIFIGMPIGIAPSVEPVMRAYGAVANFSGRTEMLEAASKAFFHQQVSPDVEMRFRGLMTECKGFAGRRNDIAHGRVETVLRGMYEWWPGDHARLLLPGLFATKKYGLNQEPMYVYSSREIAHFSICFEELSERLSALSDEIFRVYASL